MGTNLVQRGDFGGPPAEVQMETNTAGGQGREFALIQAAHSRAIMHPRRMAAVEQELLEACDRPGVALKATYTLYRKSWEKDDKGEWKKSLTIIRGPSVRLAEEAARALGHLYRIENMEFEDDRKITGSTILIDVQKNNAVSQPWRIGKTMERRQLRSGEVALEERAGSGGKVYVVPINDSEIRMKMRSATARARRDCIFEVLPSDIKESALERARKTILATIAKDRPSFIKALAAQLTAAKVAPDQVKTFLSGKRLEEVTDEQLLEVLEVVNAIEDGDATWQEAVEAVRGLDASTPFDGDDAGDRAALVGELAAAKITNPGQLAEVLQLASLDANAKVESCTTEVLRVLVNSLRSAIARVSGPAPTAAAAASSAPPATSETGDPFPACTAQTCAPGGPHHHDGCKRATPPPNTALPFDGGAAPSEKKKGR